MYWSTKTSFGISAIIDGTSQNPFSKLYFFNPNIPQDAFKTYCLDKILTCLKFNFINARSDNTNQSIDKPMTKFKSRSSLKRYMPLKPIKQGIKLWTRCYARSGYVYATNVYCGKNVKSLKGPLVNVSLKNRRCYPQWCCFDFNSFFTSTNLSNSIGFPEVGTYNKNRKNMAK